MLYKHIYVAAHLTPSLIDPLNLLDDDAALQRQEELGERLKWAGQNYKEVLSGEITVIWRDLLLTSGCNLLDPDEVTMVKFTWLQTGFLFNPNTPSRVDDDTSNSIIMVLVYTVVCEGKMQSR